MKYEVWLYVEEIDEETDHYEDVESCSVGPEFETLEEAQEFKDKMINDMEENS